MKKAFFTLLATLVVDVSQIASAQKANNLFNKRTSVHQFITDSAQMQFENQKNDININAVRHFIKSYENIDTVKWYTVEDGFIAKFMKDGIETKVEYNVAGNLRNVMRSYDESHMNFVLRDVVKRQYYDYNIIVVYEIEHNDDIKYIIKIMDKNYVKILQVINNDMKVLEDYVNGNG